MPRARRSNLSQRSRNATRLRNIAKQSTADEQEIAREKRRVIMARLRASQTQEQREVVRQTARLVMRNRRAYCSDQQRDNLRRARRNASSVDLNRVALHYDCTIDYSSHPFVRIGPMEVVCDHCGALKFSRETPGLCCLSAKDTRLSCEAINEPSVDIKQSPPSSPRPTSMERPYHDNDELNNLPTKTTSTKQDEFDVFGIFVASELRGLSNDIPLVESIKKKIQLIIVEGYETQAANKRRTIQPSKSNFPEPAKLSCLDDSVQIKIECPDDDVDY